MKVLHNYCKLLRLDHWFKNTFIFLGVFWSMMTTSDVADPYLAILAFLLTSSIASVNYIINQIADIRFDTLHPIKKHRVLPSGMITTRSALAIAGILLVTTVIISHLFFESLFVWSLIIFLAAGLVYNLQPIRLKDIPFVDVLSESINNPIRFMIGWLVVNTDVLPPASLLFSTWFVGAMLMSAKRFDELRTLGSRLVPYRSTFSAYTLSALRNSVFVYSILSVLLYSYYCLYYQPQLLKVIPVVVVYLSWLVHEILIGKIGGRSIEEYVTSAKVIWISLFAMLVAATLIR